MWHSQLHRTINPIKYFPPYKDQQGHSYEVDIWSLGVIAYAFVVGRPPF